MKQAEDKHETADEARPSRSSDDARAFGAHASPQIREGEGGAKPDEQIAQKRQQASGQGSGQT